MKKLREKAAYLKTRTEVVAPKEDNELIDFLSEFGDDLIRNNQKNAYYFWESAGTLSALREHVKEQQKFIKKLMKELENKHGK